MRRILIDTLAIAIVAVLFGAVFNYFFSPSESEPIAVTLDITHLLKSYDAELAEQKWQAEFGAMSDEERLFGAVGEPEIIY